MRGESVRLFARVECHSQRAEELAKAGVRVLKIGVQPYLPTFPPRGRYWRKQLGCWVEAVPGSCGPAQQVMQNLQCQRDIVAVAVAVAVARTPARVS